MPKKEVIHPEKTDKSFSTGAYSAGVIMDEWLYISGQGPVDFKTGQFKLDTIEKETGLTMHNIGCILKEAGCTWDDVVKCTIHLADMNDFNLYNEVYASFFTGVKPARTTVQSGLGHGIKVEIDAIAKLSAIDFKNS
jgi:2-iminobutanoate/2-iminopropanoate deaminase